MENIANYKYHKMASTELKIFENIASLADALAQAISQGIEQKNNGQWYTIALPGGSTPAVVFKHFAEFYKDKISWEKIRFFWGDERCVDPTSDESNYQMAHKNLFQPLGINPGQICRVMGEYDPPKAVMHYRGVLKEFVEEQDGLPAFDMMLLGMGDDGHTASIFPHDKKILSSLNSCDVTTHPQSGQRRVTLTLPTINNSRKVCFLVTGSAKAPMLKRVITGENANHLPAYHVKPHSGTTDWYIDRGAASMI